MNVRTGTGMNTTSAAAISTAFDSAAPLKPALLSIPTTCKYLGGISRSKCYADILPLVETVNIGTRRFVVLASLDRLIAKASTGDVLAPGAHVGEAV
jgi:hypothetical protein